MTVNGTSDSSTDKANAANDETLNAFTREETTPAEDIADADAPADAGDNGGRGDGDAGEVAPILDPQDDKDERAKSLLTFVGYAVLFVSFLSTSAGLSFTGYGGLERASLPGFGKISVAIVFGAALSGLISLGIASIYTSVVRPRLAPIWSRPVVFMTGLGLSSLSAAFAAAAIALIFYFKDIQAAAEQAILKELKPPVAGVVDGAVSLSEEFYLFSEENKEIAVIEEKVGGTCENDTPQTGCYARCEFRKRVAKDASDYSAEISNVSQRAEDVLAAIRDVKSEADWNAVYSNARALSVAPEYRAAKKFLAKTREEFTDGFLTKNNKRVLCKDTAMVRKIDRLIADMASIPQLPSETPLRPSPGFLTVAIDTLTAAFETPARLIGAKTTTTDKEWARYSIPLYMAGLIEALTAMCIMLGARDPRRMEVEHGDAASAGVQDSIAHNPNTEDITLGALANLLGETAGDVDGLSFFEELTPEEAAGLGSLLRRAITPLEEEAVFVAPVDGNEADINRADWIVKLFRLRPYLGVDRNLPIKAVGPDFALSAGASFPDSSMVRVYIASPELLLLIRLLAKKFPPKFS